MSTSILKMSLLCRSSANPLACHTSLRAIGTSHALRTKSDVSPPKPKDGGGIFSPSACFAPPDTKINRWSMFVPAFSIHVCLGAPYAWSAISASCAREYGFVASSSADWMLDACTYPMSIMIAAGGISAALMGKWTMKVGHRRAIVTGGSVFGLGFCVAAAGVMQHNLPLLYAGNLLCGMGYGATYTPPLQALLDWFPDKKGLASGFVIAGFGSGALFFTPMMNFLQKQFVVMPQYLGKTIETVTEGGKMFAQVGDGLKEVVYATVNDLAKLPYTDLAEGFYLVGSGNTGVASGLAVMGGIYAVTTMTSAFILKRPTPGYVPAGYVPPEGAGPSLNVSVGDVMKTPQFWLLFSASTLLCTGGMGLMSVAKPMIGEVFTSSMPGLVTAAFASSYLLAMAGGNLGGRLVWAGVSDKIGRRNTFHIFALGSVPLFASLPYAINQCVTDPTGPMAPLYLGLFCASTVSAITILGGIFAVLPAYEADLYGPKNVQAIHGRFLLAATLSTIAGPTLLLKLRSSSEFTAMQDLLSKVDPQKFQSLFGVDISHSQSLIEAKTLTISKLMTIMPSGTLDPSPFIYNNTMYVMAGLAGMGSALHFLVKPVDRKYFKKD